MHYFNLLYNLNVQIYINISFICNIYVIFVLIAIF